MNCCCAERHRFADYPIIALARMHIEESATDGKSVGMPAGECGVLCAICVDAASRLCGDL